jgi:predicted ribonuclease YlaK
MKSDEYQQIAADSLEIHDITMLCGKPGSGKTYLAFGYLFNMLERGRIDRIVVFCNPVVAKNAAKLGFYPGTRDEKLLGSQVGAVLSSKLGDQSEVERLIQAGQLVLLPAGDARGYEVPQNSGVYIMEAQNLTTDLLRLLLQRVSDGCKVIVDGDYEEQVDMDVYAGNNNGMRRMSEVFRDSQLFGQVELKNIYRSPIAALADNMR